MAWKICLSLVLITFVCFGNVCFSDFINLDDPLYLTRNPHVLGGLTWENVGWAFGDSSYWAGYWIPLTWLSLQLDATLFGLGSAWGFHLTNLILHAAVVVCFFLVLSRMTGSLWASALAAALYAIHPLRVESVAWVTERKDMLSTIFLVLAAGAYHHFVMRPNWCRYGLVAILFVMGLMAKPTLITFPFVLLLLDYWPLGRLRFGQQPALTPPGGSQASRRQLILEKIPLLAISVLFGMMTVYFAHKVEAVHFYVPWRDRVMVAAAGYLGYVKKTLWPTDLAVLYPFRIPSVGEASLAVVVIGLITWILFRLRGKAPALIVGWLWFLGTLVPVSGLIQVGPQALADRYTYVPHLGLSIAFAWGFTNPLVRSRLTPVAGKAILAAVLTTLGALTWIQVWYWHNSETLFSHTLRVTEDNDEIHLGLSGWWLTQGNLDEAEFHVLKALEINPHILRRRLHYGQILLRQQRYAEAEVQLREALRLEPNDPDAHYYLALALGELGQIDEARRRALESSACWALQSGPRPFDDNVAGRRVLPLLFLARLALAEGKPGEALSHLAEASQITQDLPDARQLQGIALGRLGRWAEAEAAFLGAVQLGSDNPSTRGYLAYAYSRQAKRDNAQREYAEMLKRHPDWPRRTAEFALQRVAKGPTRDPITARELALQVCEATDFRDPRWLNILATAQAASGDLASARDSARKALLLASDPELIREIREGLQRYEQSGAVPETKDGKKT